jgi:hypothetical protein
LTANHHRFRLALALLLPIAAAALSGPPQTSHPQPAPQAAQIDSGARIQPLRSGFQLPYNETLQYEGEWRFVPGGTATMRLEQSGGQSHLIANADSTGVVNLLYRIQERFNAYFDSKTLCATKVTKHSEEGSRARDTVVAYDYKRGKAVLDEHNLKDNQRKHEENDIPGCVTNMVSGIFYVASLPLQQGATYLFPVNDGGKTVTAQVHVEGREVVKTPAGEFKTLRVAPEGDAGLLLKNKGRISLWFTDDERHLPVQMRARLTWGTVTIYLTGTTK